MTRGGLSKNCSLPTEAADEPLNLSPCITVVLLEFRTRGIETGENNVAVKKDAWQLRSFPYLQEWIAKAFLQSA